MPELDDSRAEGPRVYELQVDPLLGAGEERGTTSHEHGVDPRPVLVDQPGCGGLGGESGSAQGDVAVAGLGASGRWPQAVAALTAMQDRWYRVVLDEVGDPAVASLVCLVSDGLYFTPAQFEEASVASGAASRRFSRMEACTR